MANEAALAKTETCTKKRPTRVGNNIIGDRGGIIAVIVEDQDLRTPVFSNDLEKPWNQDDHDWFRKCSRFYRVREVHPDETTEGTHAVVYSKGTGYFKRFYGDFANMRDEESVAKGAYILMEGGGTDHDAAMFVKYNHRFARGPEGMAAEILLLKNTTGKRLVEKNGRLGVGPYYTLNELGFELDKGGKPIASQNNIKLALHLLAVMARHNSFQDRSTLWGLDGFELLDDRAVDRLWLTIETEYKFRPTKEFFWTVVADDARRNSFHPVQDYLNSLEWDGKKRLDRWLVDYAKAEDSPYVRAVSALMLIAAVRRIRKPGCKFDEMPVFISEQGLNKSTALATLAGNAEWFSDHLPLGADAKTMIEHLKGRWIVEAAELNGMRKSDVQHLKSFLSRTIDRARMAYDRVSSELLRQCIIIGTTNDEEFLRDQTGNRRYWPIAVKAFDLEKLKADRDQLWAEAASREAQGESIRLAPELYPAATKEQTKRTIHEPWIEVLNAVLGDAKGKIPTSEIWRIVDVKVENRTQSHNERLGVAMKACGWLREKTRFDVVVDSKFSAEEKKVVETTKSMMIWGYVRGPKPHKQLKLNWNATHITDAAVEQAEPTRTKRKPR